MVHRKGRGRGRSSCAPPRSSRIVALGLLLSILGGASSLDPVLDAFQARYDGVRDLRARFVQESHIASLGRDETSSGRLLYLRPGRFRWETEEPEPHVLVSDGETLRMFSPEDRVMQIAPLGAGGISQTALGVLFGEANVRELFRVERMPGSDEKEIRLRLHPREAGTFERLDVVLDAGTLDVRQLEILDPLGNRTRLRLESVEVNVGVREEAFTIRVPDDTEVIDLR